MIIGGGLMEYARFVYLHAGQSPLENESSAGGVYGADSIENSFVV